MKYLQVLVIEFEYTPFGKGIYVLKQFHYKQSYPPVGVLIHEYVSARSYVNKGRISIKNKS